MEIHTEWITSGPLPDSKRIKKGCQAWIDYPSNREIKIFHHINIWIRATAGVFTELALYIGTRVPLTVTPALIKVYEKGQNLEKILHAKIILNRCHFLRKGTVCL